MPVLKLKQVKFESDTWKRLLGFMMDENIYLKNRLSEILKDRFDKKLLEDVEGFQTHFIKEDERIGLLRHDLAELEKLLVKEIFEDRKIIKEKEIYKKLKILRYNILNAERQFGTLKVDFNNYLSANI